MPAFIFRRSASGQNESAKEYQGDEEAIEAALADPHAVSRVVMADGRVMERVDLERFSAAAKNPQ